MLNRVYLQTTREKYGYTQQQIAEGLGCNRSTIAQIERGLINGGPYYKMYYGVMLAEALDDAKGRENELILGLINERERVVAPVIKSHTPNTNKEDKVNRIKFLVNDLGGYKDEK